MAEWDHCPGQNTQFWKPGDIFDVLCPHCGVRVEFWKDELRRRCKGCGNELANPKHDMGCAAWCEHADKCFGAVAGADGGGEATTARMKARLMAEMKKTFGADARRVAHALKVLQYAEEILKNEAGADALVVVAAALLHDIGIKEAERKHGSNAARFQEIEGPPIARRIMESLEIPAETADEVADIIAHHHQPKALDTNNFRILLDADRIVNLQEEGGAASADDAFIEKNFITGTGRRIAKEIFKK